MTTSTPPTALIAGLQDLHDHMRDGFSSCEPSRALLREAIRILAADRQSASRATPEGWVCVPREPTSEMLNAYWDCIDRHTAGGTLLSKAADRYRALIAAATPAGALTVLQPSVAVPAVVDAEAVADDDSTRYRWLRKVSHPLEGIVEILECDKPELGTLHGSRLDAFIDSAMQAEATHPAPASASESAALTANQAAEAPPVAVEATKAVAREPAHETDIIDITEPIEPHSGYYIKIWRAAEKFHGIGLDNKEPK